MCLQNKILACSISTVPNLRVCHLSRTSTIYLSHFTQQVCFGATLDWAVTPIGNIIFQSDEPCRCAVSIYIECTIDAACIWYWQQFPGSLSSEFLLSAPLWPILLYTAPCAAAAWVCQSSWTNLCESSNFICFPAATTRRLFWLIASTNLSSAVSHLTTPIFVWRDLKFESGLT